MPKPSGNGRPGSASGPAVALVVSRYNSSVTDRLRDGALREYLSRNPGEPAGVLVVEAPGAFELPALCLAAVRTGRFDGVVAIGCLIRGETPHDRYIAQAVAQGLVAVTIQTQVPVAFGVLTVNTPRQARERAGGKRGNKGQEAMAALLDTIGQVRRLRGEMVTPSAVASKAPDKAARRRRGKP